eukprot:2079894-Rhodomonas_salina.2
MGDECFEVVTLDLIRPSLTMPAATRALMGVVRGHCPVLQAPKRGLDLTLYPLMDPNLYRCIPYLANTVLIAVVETARVSAQRCKRHGGTSMMCMPDVRRVDDFAAVALQAGGTLLDNWLNIGLVMIEAALGGDPPENALFFVINPTVHIVRALFDYCDLSRRGTSRRPSSCC